VKLSLAGKDQRKVVTAVGRELLGFLWAIGVRAEAAGRQMAAAG
jgi:transposase